MRLLLLPLLLASSQVWAEACIIHSQGERVDVKLCQENRSIPAELFRTGFCQPQIPGQEVEVEFVEQCPTGAFGICENAQVSNIAYRQDIHYYGVDTDARFLKPACEQNSQGTWLAPQD
ncbi:NADH:ubiquinone oxidoreductase [Stutzerimonas nosocomialis]|uniref:NADH:ubiquinone oxidoreductase n=1 Tax=Stutzerimonas nosocomialis TaxID=1056496 RepID=UPI001108DCBD|nr:NADH:ubiquinone oxidoreductase [Stutzerimonas nosocomialis]TLX56448.1 NADH:ubiquinone oxidoreductase [Stutzerimonas nosocomialis]